MLVTAVSCFTADTCQGWTRLWLDQLPGLYFLLDHLGTGMVTGEKEGRDRERVLVIAVDGGLEEANTSTVSFQPGSHYLITLEGVSRVSQRLGGGAVLGKMRGGGRGFTFIRVQGGGGLDAETEDGETHSRP